MADDSNEVRISITLDDGSVREGFARIKKEGEDTGHGLKEAFSDIKKELVGLIAAYIGFEAGKKLIEESIHAAQSYESALNNMQKSLAAAGSYSHEAALSFVELAENIEKTTTTSATQALQLEALARNYSRNNEQAKALTKAAIDLAAATGKDATTALQQLGGTLDGSAGKIAKLIPQVGALTEYQLRMGDAIGIVANRFKDSAAGDIDTFAGTLQRLKNGFETLQISLGQFITNTPLIRAAMKLLTDEFNKIAEVLRRFSSDQSFLKQLSMDAIEFGRAINDFVIYPLELFYNTAKIVFNAVGELMVGQLNNFSVLAAKIVGFFAPDSKIAATLRDFSAKTTQLMHDMGDSVEESIGKWGDTKWTDGITSGLNTLQTAVQNVKPFNQMRQDMNDAKDDGLRLSGELANVHAAFEQMRSGATSSLALLAADSNRYCQQIGSSVAKTFIGGVANAMAAMGRALVHGKDIFKAFAGAMLAALGQAAIQMGAMYILMGTARAFGSYGLDATAWGLISTGTAMSVLGGVLMALGEGVSGESTGVGAGGAGGGGGGIGSPVGGVNPANSVAPGEQKRVEINIHGSVFDTKETGLRIVELVNDAFNTQGAQVLVK